MGIGMIVSIVFLGIGLYSTVKKRSLGCAWIVGAVIGLWVFLFFDKKADTFFGLIITFLIVGGMAAVFFLSNERVRGEVSYEETIVSVAVPLKKKESNVVDFCEYRRKLADEPQM